MFPFGDRFDEALFGDRGAFRLPSWVAELASRTGISRGDLWDEYLYLVERGKTEPNARRILMAKHGALSLDR